MSKDLNAITDNETISPMIPIVQSVRTTRESIRVVGVYKPESQRIRTRGGRTLVRLMITPINSCSRNISPLVIGRESRYRSLPSCALSTNLLPLHDATLKDISIQEARAIIEEVVRQCHNKF